MYRCFYCIKRNVRCQWAVVVSQATLIINCWLYLFLAAELILS